jgi:hypothetical protein
MADARDQPLEQRPLVGRQVGHVADPQGKLGVGQRHFDAEPEIPGQTAKQAPGAR